LKLVRHSWTPETIREAVRLVVEIPSYRRAAESLVALTKMPLSKSSLSALVQEYGQRLVEQQNAEVEGRSQFAEREPEAETMAVSLDGVMVHLRGEGWKEAKVAAFSAVTSVAAAEGHEPQVQLGHHSYRAGLWEAAEFAKQQWAEATRRGIEQAKRIVAVSDGAAWIWAIVWACYAPCVQIIDWWHALEKLWQIVHARYQPETAQALAWQAKLKTCLWSGDFHALLGELRGAWPRGQHLPASVGQALGYLFRHRQRMHYQTFRQAGYPVGSGTVESACKVVVQQRLCQAGMRWERPRAQALLALRCSLLSNRWEATWRSLSPPQVT
jgi:hypothetical protein